MNPAHGLGRVAVAWARAHQGGTHRTRHDDQLVRRAFAAVNHGVPMQGRLIHVLEPLPDFINAQHGAQPSVSAAAARTTAHVCREQHAGEIFTESAELLSLPDDATDSVNIHRNADDLVGMLKARSFTNTRLRIVPDGSPAVYGELMQPGARKTLMLCAHSDGQPVDSSIWTTPPFSPVLRTKEVHLGCAEIPISAGNETVDVEAHTYGRGAGDDTGSIRAILSALDWIRASQLASSVNIEVFFDGEEEAGSGQLEQILTTYAEQLRGDAWRFCDGRVHRGSRQQLSFGQRPALNGRGICVGGVRETGSDKRGRDAATGVECHPGWQRTGGPVRAEPEGIDDLAANYEPGRQPARAELMGCHRAVCGTAHEHRQDMARSGAVMR